MLQSDYMSSPQPKPVGSLERMRPYLILVFATLSIFLFPNRSLAGFQVDTGGTLTTGLVSYWGLEGNSNDFYASNNGTDTNISYSTNYGKVNQGAEFDYNSAKHIDFPDDMISAAGAASINVWLYATGSQAMYATALAGNSSNGDPGGYWWTAIAATGNSWSGHIGGGFCTANNNRVFVDSGVGVSSGAWTMVTITYDRSYVSIYVNGVYKNKTAATGDIIGYGGGGIGPLRLGNETGNSGSDHDAFGGYLDEVGLWSKALSQQEITDLYNGGTGQTMTGYSLSLSSPQQYRSDATTTISPGGITTESSVVFGALLSSFATSTLQLQAEVKPTGFPFTGTPNVTSTFVSPGNNATATYSGSNGSYRWQARAVDSNGSSSAWKTFGIDSASTTDFIIDYTAPNEESAHFASSSAWSWTIPMGTLSETGPFTIELWYKAAASTTVGDLIDTRSSGTGKGFVLSKSSDGINFLLSCAATSSVQFTEGAHAVNHDSSPSSTPYWHHVAITQSASTSVNAFNLYFDSVEQTSTNSCFDSSTTKPIWFARSALTSTDFFTGDMDEVRIWDVERSASEISSTAAEEISPTSTGLLAYWTFNDTSTELISGNATSGQVGSPSFSSSSPIGSHFIFPYPSVYNGGIQWYGSTKYSSEWNGAVGTWSAEGPIVISSTTASSTALVVSDVSTTDLWTGRYTPPLVLGASTSTLELNTYFLDQDIASSVQNTITHELGHALGLDHSVFGNVMYYAQTTQTTLGNQDQSDYNYLWGD